MQALRKFVVHLPPDNRLVLDKLVEFLCHVSEASGINEMTPFALAQAFAPVLCKSLYTAFMSLKHMQSLPQIRVVVQALVENYSAVFDVRIIFYCHERCISHAAFRREKCDQHFTPRYPMERNRGKKCTKKIRGESIN